MIKFKIFRLRIINSRPLTLPVTLLLWVNQPLINILIKELAR